MYSIHKQWASSSGPLLHPGPKKTASAPSPASHATTPASLGVSASVPPHTRSLGRRPPIPGPSAFVACIQLSLQSSCILHVAARGVLEKRASDHARDGLAAPVLPCSLLRRRARAHVSGTRHMQARNRHAASESRGAGAHLTHGTRPPHRTHTSRTSPARERQEHAGLDWRRGKSRWRKARA